MTITTQAISGLQSPSIQGNNNQSSVKSMTQSFQQALSDAIGNMNQTESNANNQVNQLVNGNASDLSTVTIAMEKSDLMLQLAVNVRDKVVNAYQEVMRMQI